MSAKTIIPYLTRSKLRKKDQIFVRTFRTAIKYFSSTSTISLPKFCPKSLWRNYYICKNIRYFDFIAF